MGSIYQSIELLSKEKGIETQIVLDAVKLALLSWRASTIARMNITSPS